MNKSTKSAIAIIVIVVLAFLIIFVLYDMFHPKELKDQNQLESVTKDSNTGLDNLINTLYDNVVIQEDGVEQENLSEEEMQKAKNSITESLEKQEDSQVLNGVKSTKEEKAIEIAKKNWGDTSGVYFTIMGVDIDGRYIVTVKDQNTTKELKRYIVDIETGRCTEK